jgi:outer membrane lipoprotein LolB
MINNLKLISNFWRYAVGFLLWLNLMACQTAPSSVQQPIATTEYSKKLSALTHWQISGKIAFIGPDEKQSANFNWQVNEKNNEQTLHLTNFLGVNMLSITSQQNINQVEFDGKTYQSSDLNALIYQLTHLVLPTQALHHWLKGLPTSPFDQVLFNQQTQLPEQILSQYQAQIWRIQFLQYQWVNGLALPKKITISTEKLTLKIVINQWQLFV